MEKAPMHVRLIESRPDCGPDTIAIHGEALKISLRRTIRVPDTADTASLLPPNLGLFPLMSVKQFEDKLPTFMAEKGGVFFPMHQREAMWIRFESETQFAIKIYVGGVNAISGEPSPEDMASRMRRQKRLSEGKSIQDYVVLPQQLWLDGVATKEGQVRQFVAVRTGSGHTVEAQITGKETVAGIQFEVTRKKYDYKKKISIHAREHNPASGKGEFNCIATIRVDPDMLISELINAVKEETKMELGRTNIFIRDDDLWKSLTSIDEEKDPGGNILDRTLGFYGLEGLLDSTIRVQPKILRNIFVQDADSTITLHNVCIERDSRDLVREVASKSRISPESARLFYGGKDLSRGGTLEDYSLGEGATIHLITRLPGGASKCWYGGFDMGQEYVHVEMPVEMGFAAGGLIKQYIQKDTYSPDSWDQTTTTTFNLQVLDSSVFKKVTGFAPPRCPIDAETYKAHGHPFFDISEDESDVAGDFGDLKSLRELFFQDDGKVRLNPNGPRSPFRTLEDLERDTRGGGGWGFLGGDRK